MFLTSFTVNACWNTEKDSVAVWTYCETIPAKIRKQYTAETCVDNPSLRHENWAVGACVYPNISNEGLWWAKSTGFEEVTWAELAAEDSPWTDRHGNPLCIVEEGV